AKLIFRAYLTQGDAPVFHGNAAAAAVVADLNQLILQGAVGEVVADAGGEVEAFASFAAVADESANLVGQRLENGIGLQTEMGHSGEELAVGLDFDEGA